MTRESPAWKASDLLAALVGEKYLSHAGRTPEGLSFAAVCSEGHSIVAHNLGSIRPTKQEAIAVLTALKDHIDLLVDELPSLKEQLRTSPLRLELCVDSGPMSFIVCTWAGHGPIDWQTELP